MRPALERAAREARRLCGCVQCQGGYPIGARTLQRSVYRDTDMLSRRPEVPSSCLAPVLLQEILAAGLPEEDPEELPEREGFRAGEEVATTFLGTPCRMCGHSYNHHLHEGSTFDCQVVGCDCGHFRPPAKEENDGRT